MLRDGLGLLGQFMERLSLQCGRVELCSHHGLWRKDLVSHLLDDLLLRGGGGLRELWSRLGDVIVPVDRKDRDVFAGNLAG